uniref:Snurportin-1 n=1 Tax=Lotharella globosa TaxID=91324 RepID=A0A7S3Y8V3_9EUKA
METERDPVAEAKKREKRQEHLRRRREWFARQLMYPEWMTEIPRDLGSNWYVLPRPEGIRCLVISSRGKTISRKKSGSILHNFQSALPNGNRHQMKQDPCILDCVYQPQKQIYYVLDLMCWGGYSIYDSATDFRHFWVHSKLSEVPIHSVNSENKFKFAPVPRFSADTAGLRKAYGGGSSSAHNFQMDGLLFIHKKTHYHFGLSPLCLVWKDAKTSRFFVDSSDGKTVPPKQSCTLYCQPDGKVMSLEGQVVGTLTQQVVAQAKIRLDCLHKFTVDRVSISQNSGIEVVEGLSYAGPGSKARVLPDSWSKIVFQSQARRGRTPSILEIAKRCAVAGAIYGDAQTTAIARNQHERDVNEAKTKSMGMET